MPREASTNGRSCHPLVPCDDSTLDRALLDLHGVQEMRDFWEKTRRVLHAALPLHYVCLCLRPFALLPSTVFRERAPFASEEEFRLFQELNPLQDHLATHAGETLTRMSDIVPDVDLPGTKFFQRFMLPHDDRYFACLNFWRDGLFQGLIGLHRTAGQRDFTEADMVFLSRLHPHFNTALQRILNVHRERAVRLSLEKLLVELPIATVLLDWEFRVAYRNRAAIAACATWIHGRERARAEKHTDDFTIPAAVVGFCREFKATWQPAHHRCCALTTAAGVTLTHPEIPGLRASINLLQLDAAPLSMPIFLIRFEDVSANGTHSENGDALRRISRLTLREREVAMLIGQGCSNEEVALRLRKSVLTVKKQLHSIYHKLAIDGRGRLIAMLR
jgi:DNA-binding CsgD family transcriptional regulator